MSTGHHWPSITEVAERHGLRRATVARRMGKDRWTDQRHTFQAATVETRQRSRIQIMAVHGAKLDASAVTDLTAYLPPETIVVLDGPGEIQEMGTTLHARLGNTGRLIRVNEILARCNRFTDGTLVPLNLHQGFTVDNSTC